MCSKYYMGTRFSVTFAIFHLLATLNCNSHKIVDIVQSNLVLTQNTNILTTCAPKMNPLRSNAPKHKTKLYLLACGLFPYI